MKRHNKPQADAGTPGDQSGHYETGTPQEVRQETHSLNSLGWDSQSPKPERKE